MHISILAGHVKAVDIQIFLQHLYLWDLNLLTWENVYFPSALPIALAGFWAQLLSV